MTTKAYVQIQGKTYYARVIIPKHLHSSMGRTKYNESLKTDKYVDAIIAAAPLVEAWQAKIAVAEHAFQSEIEFADCDIDRDKFSEALINRVDDELTILGRIIHVQAHQTGGTRGALLKEIIDARHIIEYLDSGKADFAENFKSYMAKGGIWITEKSHLWETRYQMSVNIFKRGIEKYVNIHKNREAAKVAAMTNADYIKHMTAPAPKPATVNKFLKPDDASDTITQCFERILKAKPRIRDNQKERGRWQNVVDALVDHFGEDKPVNYISYAEATDFLISMENYPAIRSKPELKGKTFRQKIEWVKARKSKGIEEKCVTGKTIDDWCGKLATICDLVIQDGKAFMNPFRNQKIEIGRESVEKKPFDQKELVTIFSNIKQEKNQDRFWISLFLLYHGCRLSEFVNRKIEDLIKHDSGVWYIDITKGKNKKSVRCLPIHKDILNLGFVEYVQSTKRKKHEYIFGSFNTSGRVIDGVHRPSGLPSQQYTNWFNGQFLREKLKITEPEKTLHSFRHNWVSRATALKIDKLLRVKLAGHTDGKSLDIHDDIYTHIELVELKEALDLVKYDVLEPIMTAA